MAKGLARAVRRALLTHLKANDGISDIVGARVYGQIAPDQVQWPFVKMGATSMTPIKAACVDGSDFRVTVHVFAKGSPTVTPEDALARLVGAVERAGDGAKLALVDSDLPDLAGHVALSLIGSQSLVDGQDAMHGVIDFRARALA